MGTLAVRERPDGSIYLQGEGGLRGFHYVLAPGEGMARALATFAALCREAGAGGGG